MASPETRTTRDMAREWLSRAAQRVEHTLEASSRTKLLAKETCAVPTAELALAMVRSIRAGGKVLVFGNGGSAADAQHLAGELVGRFRLRDRPALPAIALTTDTSVLTAVGNDFAFEEVFARQVQALARRGDVVIGISTSGRSENVRRGIVAARNAGCLTAVIVGGEKGPILEKADIAVVVPETDTQRIQESHICLIHALCELIEEELTR